MMTSQVGLSFFGRRDFMSEKGILEKPVIAGI